LLRVPYTKPENRKNGEKEEGMEKYPALTAFKTTFILDLKKI
jgi:hypothetical protein